MLQRILLAVLGLAAVPALAQTVSFEAFLFPDQEGWVRLPQAYYADRWLEDGWLVQYAEMVKGGPVPEGERDSYRRELDDQAGLPTWFLQFRLITDAPPVYGDVGPAALALSGTSPPAVLYHFVIGDSQIRFLRDVALPYVYVDIEVGLAHTYRLELGDGTYVLYVDGVNVDAGASQGPYPRPDSFITFRGMASGQATTTRWDYVRLGKNQVPHSADYNSDGLVGQDDLYFFIDCLLGPDYDAAGPGCRFGDVNADGVANGADIALFVDLMIGP